MITSFLRAGCEYRRKSKTKEIEDGEKDDRKGLELLQKFCIFLQNVNENFENFLYTETGVKEGGGAWDREGTFQKY